MREPSEAETVKRIAAGEASQIWTALPGIITAYRPGPPCEVDVIPAVFSGEDNGPMDPVTAPLRLWGAGGMIGGAGPLPGNHCTLIYHGLDPGAFWAAPTSPARAELLRGKYPEAWPAPYVVQGPAPATLWLGTADGLTNGVKITAASAQIGGVAATSPAVLGDVLAAYMATLYAWCNLPGLVAQAGAPPPVPTSFVSTKVFVSP